MASEVCSACGAENPAGSAFCRQCARRLDEATRESVTRQRAAALQDQPTGIRWTAVLIVLLVILIVAALVVAVAFFHL